MDGRATASPSGSTSTSSKSVAQTSVASSSSAAAASSARKPAGKDKPVASTSVAKAPPKKLTPQLRLMKLKMQAKVDVNWKKPSSSKSFGASLPGPPPPPNRATWRSRRMRGSIFGFTLGRLGSLLSSSCSLTRFCSSFRVAHYLQVSLLLNHTPFLLNRSGRLVEFWTGWHSSQGL